MLHLQNVSEKRTAGPSQTVLVGIAWKQMDVTISYEAKEEGPRASRIKVKKVESSKERTNNLNTCSMGYANGLSNIIALKNGRRYLLLVIPGTGFPLPRSDSLTVLKYKVPTSIHYPLHPLLGSQSSHEQLQP